MAGSIPNVFQHLNRSADLLVAGQFVERRAEFHFTFLEAPGAALSQSQVLMEERARRTITAHLDSFIQLRDGLVPLTCLRSGDGEVTERARAFVGAVLCL